MKRLTDQHYRDVAVAYLNACNLGRHPTQAVADHFKVSNACAGKWVIETRKRSLLPPTRSGSKAPSRNRHAVELAKRFNVSYEAVMQAAREIANGNLRIIVKESEQTND